MNTDMNNDMKQQSKISINILIVEDDAIQLRGLKHIITEHYPGVSVFTASCFSEATAIIDSSELDLFMLDINLGDGKSGLDVCSYLRGRSEYKDTPVLFITDVTNPSLDVINKYHCRYYFSKPYSSDDVVSAINSVLNGPGTVPAKLQLKDIQGIMFHVIPQDIIFVRSDGHHKHIFTVNGDFIVTNPTFDTVLEKPDIPLVRCHRSYFFNPGFIHSYDRANCLLMLSGVQDSIPIGRKYKTETEKYLENR